MARLERIEDLADKFVRVRLPRIDRVDLNLFEFDYDLTFMAFFLNAEEQIYARYGGRDARSPDSRQSVAGLRYTMQSALQMHERNEKTFAPRLRKASRFLREASTSGRFGRGCVHCHQVKEARNADLDREGKWDRNLAWRYPLPENLGFELEVDRGNVIREVKDHSSAFAAGLKRGDVLRRLNGVPIHSFADTQFALDIAPKTGAIEVVWQRGDAVQTGKLSLPAGWRQTDISWRPSMRASVPNPRLYGPDLTPEEKTALGLPPKQLAFRQKDSVSKDAQAAGVRGGDIILGIAGKPLDTNADGFLKHVRSNYLVGDEVTINVIRNGNRLNLAMTLPR